MVNFIYGMIKNCSRYVTRLMVITILCSATEVLATNYYINPKGNDLWSGTIQQPNEDLTDGPFRSISRAKEAIITLKKASEFNDKVTVTIATGNYYLDHQLNFGLVDSGIVGREIIWQGELGGSVTISAGIPIDCRRNDDTFWVCQLTQLPENTNYYDNFRIKGNAPKFELYVNDQKQKLARWPDQGWAHIKVPLDEKMQFTVMEALPIFHDDIADAQIHIFAGNDWYDQYIGIASVNESINSVTLTSPTVYSLKSGRRFYIQNLPSSINSPGEWIYETVSKRITFIPLGGTIPTEMVLSSLPNILFVDGASYLTFRNINFQHSTGSAIILKNSNNILLDRLDINNIGGFGVEIQNGMNVQVENSEIHQTGAGGIDVSGGDKITLQASGHRIYNSHIHNVANTILTNSPCIKVRGVGTKITHNLLEQGANSAIVVTGNDHLIEKNEIHHFCLQTADCGAVYTGRDWSWRGNIIRNNYIHDIVGYGMESVDVENNMAIYTSPLLSAGVYLDDGASGFEVTGNIFENAGTMAVQVGGGRDNKIYNNYFNSNYCAITIQYRKSDVVWNQLIQRLDESPYKTAIWQQKYPELAVGMNNLLWPEGNRITRNIIVSNSSDSSFLKYSIPKASTIIQNNLIWSTMGKLVVDYNILDLNKSGLRNSWMQWLAQGIEQNSIVSDPCVTISNGKLSICPSAPINDIGFIPLPIDIGLEQIPIILDINNSNTIEKYN